jgi:predicted nucleic acid-binding protein
VPSRPPPLRVYADSCLYISVIKRDADVLADGTPRWQVSRSLFAAAQRGDVLILASTLVQAEVLGNGEVRTRPADSQVQTMVSDWFLADYVEWCDVDRMISRRVGELSGRYGLRGADAVHLASAIRLRADVLMSNDGGFASCHGQVIDGVRVLKPEVVWQETLDDLV